MSADARLAVFTEAELDRLKKLLYAVEGFKDILDQLFDSEIKGLSLYGVFRLIDQEFAEVLGDIDARIKAAKNGGGVE